ncbi:MAG TPA: DUF4349 domain-containing protein [Desulfobacteria bacterium]|nr:DUF4349 domain-containing protein [Desulfobacteria bacterium]
MHCSEIREMLSFYIDDVLEQTDRARVEGHLNTCGTCRQELEDLQASVRLIRSLGEVLPPENFRSELMSKLREAPLSSRKDLKSRIKELGGLIFGGPSGTWKYAAAAVIIIGIGIGTGLYQLNQTNLDSFDKRSEIAGKTDNFYNAGSSSNKMAAPPKGESGADDLLTLRMEKDEQVTERKSEKIIASNPDGGKAAAADQAGDAERVEDKSAAVPGAVPEAASVQGLVENQEDSKSVQKIVKEASLSLEVENYRDFSSRLLTVTEQFGGYIENSSENLDSAASASFVVRVPNSRFSDLIGAVEKLGKIKVKQVSGRDVTGELVDTESRLRNFQAQEQRLLSLMDKAEDLSDLVTLENELSRIRGEIETLQGRLKVLDDTVVYSTIRLEVSQVNRPEVVPPAGTVGKAISNFKQSCIALINFMGNIITFTGWILPWALFVGATGGSVAYYRKTKHKRDDNQVEKRQV